MSGDNRPAKPGEIEIERFILKNFAESDETDLSQIELEFSYHEDLFSPTISATVIVNDASGILNGFPVVGDETLELSFRDKRNPETIDVVLRSYKVGARTRTAERAVTYPIFFASSKAVVDPKSGYTNAFEGKISDLVRTFGGFSEIEETEGLFRYVGTDETFFDTMRILAREAKSAQHKSSTYLFYELSDGYKFITLESLFNKPTSQTYYYALSNINNQKGVQPVNDFVKIQKLEHIKNNDLVESMKSGLYGSETNVIDPLRKTFNAKTLDYFQDGFDKTKHIAQQASPISPQLFTEAFASGGAHRKYFVSDLRDIAPTSYIRNNDPTTENFGRNRHLFVDFETSLFQQAKSIKFRISIPGDSSRHAGDIIEIMFPEPEASKDALYQYDKYLSGRFLVVSVQHLLQINKEYVTVMECVKDSFEETITNNKLLAQGFSGDF